MTWHDTRREEKRWQEMTRHDMAWHVTWASNSISSNSGVSSASSGATASDSGGSTACSKDNTASDGAIAVPANIITTFFFSVIYWINPFLNKKYVIHYICDWIYILFNLTVTSLKRARGCGRPCCRELALATFIVHFRWLPSFRTVLEKILGIFWETVSLKPEFFFGNFLGFGRVRLS